MHERGRAAAVEVDRALGAELDHHLGQLEHREPGVDAGAAPVAGDGDHVAGADPQRRARMAAVGDVGVELPRAAREALAVVAGVERDRAAGDQQRPGLHEVAARRLGASARVPKRTPSPSLITHARSAA